MNSLGFAGSVQHQGAVLALQSELLENLVSDNGCIATLVQHHVNEDAAAIRGKEVGLGCREGYRICGRTLMGVEGPCSQWGFVEQRVFLQQPWIPHSFRYLQRRAWCRDPKHAKHRSFDAVKFRRSDNPMRRTRGSVPGDGGSCISRNVEDLSEELVMYSSSRGLICSCSLWLFFVGVLVGCRSVAQPRAETGELVLFG